MAVIRSDCLTVLSLIIGVPHWSNKSSTSNMRRFDSSAT
jgi:hypothetical protein